MRYLAWRSLFCNACTSASATGNLEGAREVRLTIRPEGATGCEIVREGARGCQRARGGSRGRRGFKTDRHKAHTFVHLRFGTVFDPHARLAHDHGLLLATQRAVRMHQLWNRTEVTLRKRREGTRGYERRGVSRSITAQSIPPPLASAATQPPIAAALAGKSHLRGRPSP